MKLSNQQIEALTDVLVNKVAARVKPDNEKKIAEARAAANKRAKQLMKIYKTLPSDLKSVMYYSSDLTEQKMTNSLCKSVKTTDVCRNDIRRKIILASIDAESVEEIKKKFKIEF